jgi:putative SOS response-associated peptidase YedK
MCGRYVTRTEDALGQEFRLLRVRWPQMSSYNIAPTRQVPAVRCTAEGREGLMMRWGLVPHWTRGNPAKFPLFNTRLETAASGAMTRDAWRRGQRCILPALGFYEWQQQASQRQPFYIHRRDEAFLALAGLWDRSVGEEGVEILSCTILTREAGVLVGEIHNTKHRQPVMLTPDAIDTWLEGAQAEALAATALYPDELLEAWPVSRRVNTATHDDAGLVERLSA